MPAPDRIEVYNSSIGEAIAQVPESGSEGFAAAVERASAAATRVERHRGAGAADRGYRFPPTLFDRVTPDMTIEREEIFGPVLGVIGWEDEAEMLAAMNATYYGLTASICTRDLAVAHRLAGEIEAGYICTNEVEKRWAGCRSAARRTAGPGPTTRSRSSTAIPRTRLRA